MGSWLLRGLRFVLIAGCIGLALYPVASRQYSRFQNARLISQYESAVDALDPQERASALERWRQYNANWWDIHLGDVFTRTVSSSGGDRLTNELQAVGGGVLCTVEIPRLGVILPVRRSSDAETLEYGAVYVEGSSLPVGGNNVHTALAAYGGWLGGGWFRSLGRVCEGDLFYISVLGERLTYEVDRVQTSPADEVDELERDEEESFCTLMTRTPYAGADKRVLVRGRLTEERLAAANDGIARVPDVVSALVLGLPVAILAAALLILSELTRRAAQRWHIWRMKL